MRALLVWLPFLAALLSASAPADGAEPRASAKDAGSNRDVLARKDR